MTDLIKPIVITCINAGSGSEYFKEQFMTEIKPASPWLPYPKFKPSKGAGWYPVKTNRWIPFFLSLREGETDFRPIGTDDITGLNEEIRYFVDWPAPENKS